MKLQAVIGWGLIAVGVLILVLPGIPLARSNVADSAAPKVAGQDQESVPISRMIGAVSLAGGIFVVVLGSRK